MLISMLFGCAPEVFLTEQGLDSVGLVLAVHGSGDNPSVWPEELLSIIENKADDNWDLVAYDWSEDADSKLRAAKLGEKHGEALGEILNTERDYQIVHVISHSAGAHVAHGIEKTLEKGVLQLTFLDPFGGLGVIRWGYGKNHFGEKADFADCYFNDDDGVPSTESCPENTLSHDVTREKPKNYEEGHWWPIDWYIGSEGTGSGLDLAICLGNEGNW